MNEFNLLKIFGLLTYIFVLITVISGVLRAKIKVHKAIAVITLVLATVHALLVIFLD